MANGLSFEDALLAEFEAPKVLPNVLPELLEGEEVPKVLLDELEGEPNRLAAFDEALLFELDPPNGEDEPKVDAELEEPPNRLPDCDWPDGEPNELFVELVENALFDDELFEPPPKPPPNGAEELLLVLLVLLVDRLPWLARGLPLEGEEVPVGF